ncbi:protein-tyrosine phosphatase-like protein [Pavlovales sp. CCMP2436]|nr:protein-tyrosine phosphatase-like protein [Pavlovales sp. CCMP2436]|mmetsp:Transcript_21642/g.54915  ORF Transcript_21642/g.54915 Transcript_21642/m.54915 type:complete len:223 (+) Transcript_21642:145-813(+)
MPFNFLPAHAAPSSGAAEEPIESIVLKNWQKWWAVEAVAREHLKGVVPMKMPFHGQDLHPSNHDVTSLLAQFPQVARIVDLQSDGEAYLTPSTCERIRLFSKSKAPPTQEVVDAFIAIVEPFIRARPGALVAVHCHYGFNRTGFLVAAYLAECHGYSADEAIEAFARARPPGLKHEHFKEELRARYRRRSWPRSASSRLSLVVAGVVAAFALGLTLQRLRDL